MFIKNDNNQGTILVLILSATALFLIILLGSISLGQLQHKLNKQKVASTQAIHIAEAGVNYYRWVLYHNHEDYCNTGAGETCMGGPDYGPYGPYSYTDITGTITGYYELYITPPSLNGSTIVNIRSIGWSTANPNLKREVEVRCGIPSWSTYSTLCDSDIRFGEGTEVWGPIHSNHGIRFDGVAHNVISSALLDYDDPDHSGSNEFAVHTHFSSTDPLPDGNNPPLNVPERTDVFMAGREFPASTISFDLLDSYLSDTLAKATSSDGLLIPSSGGLGYHITITPVPGTSTDTITFRRVNSVSSGCTDSNCISSESTVYIETPPPNGVIFVKDKIWIDGQIEDERITFLAFSDPITGDTTDIVINNDLLFTYYDGTDSLGLIAQNNINIGLCSEDDLRIDAALIAKEGRIGRPYFQSSCSSTYFKRDTITVYGALATKGRYGFSWSCSGTWCSGYQYRNLIYDNNLTFAPPPHYPTTGEYTFISWKEK